MSDIQLYGYYRSTAAYRVRIALAFKHLAYENISVHLVQDGGQQHHADYVAINPQHLVPTLKDNSTGITLSQSLAIIEYLEEQYPERSLLPQLASARGYVRSLAQIIACDIHPLDNLRVLQYLVGELGVNDAQKNKWYQHWISEGFTALETLLATNAATGACCYGDTPSLADLCLIPQVYNANRFKMDLAPYPNILRINAHCLSLDCFSVSIPEVQPDAPK